MADEDRRGRLVVVVGNAVEGDSRVQKTALAASRAGWEVTLVGQSTSGRREELTMGDVRVLRVPLVRTRHESWVRDDARRTMLRQRWEASPATAARAWCRGLDTFPRVRGSLARRRPDPRGVLTLGRDAVRQGAADLRDARARRSAQRRYEATGVVDWRTEWPILQDWTDTLAPVLVELRPDVIHANDVNMLGPAHEAAQRLRAEGHRVAWLYDAHEHVRSVDWGGPRVSAAYRSLEDDLIRAADAVVTVADDIAAKLRQEHRLGSTPVVVRNVPVAARPDEGHVGVRRTCGVADGVPLLVYSGYLAPERGVDTAVRALPSLPGVHLAVVSSGRGGLYDVLVAEAERLGVSDRLHFVPYVAPAFITDYFRTADVGIVTSHHHPNYENSMPSKLSEYLHAGLALVVSDLRVNAAFVREHAVGEVFVAEDVESFVSAVGSVVAEPVRYLSAITPGVLADLSWEHQVQRLLDQYLSLSGIAVRPPEEPVPWEAELTPA